MPTAEEEVALIGRIVAGEKELFHELIRPYQRTAYMTALAILKNEGDAEDAAQEGIIKAYRALAGFRAESKFSTWLVSIVMNEARSRLRKVSSTPVESLDSKVESEEECTPAMIADWREIPLEMLEREELAGQIRKAIEELPSSYREVFLLRDKGELSIAEIAESLGIQANLVKVRLFRARMSLQKTLTPYLKQQISSGKRWYSWMGGAR